MKIGIIGGSGLYAIEGIQHLHEERLDTPFGAPSDAYMCGTLHGREVVFLPRHARGHRLIPSEIPFRANVWGLKKLGVTHLLSVSAVGSLQEHIAPGHMVFPDQFVDRTFLRPSTFFGRGIVAHVQLGHPVCPVMLETLGSTARELEVTAHTGGSYVCIEGPSFSTKAESMLYRTWGISVVGMTNMQEARLAREAEMCFATIALSTDYDSWHETEAEVSVEAVLEVMRQNIDTSKRIVAHAVRTLPNERTCTCSEALRYAILTAPEHIPEQTRADLAPLIGHRLPQS